MTCLFLHGFQGLWKGNENPQHHTFTKKVNSGAEVLTELSIFTFVMVGNRGLFLNMVHKQPVGITMEPCLFVYFSIKQIQNILKRLKLGKLRFQGAILFYTLSAPVCKAADPGATPFSLAPIAWLGVQS